MIRPSFLAVLIAGGVLSQNFDQIDYNEVRDIFTNKCVENGASQETISLVPKVPLKLNSCFESYLNYTVVQTELQEARKNGSIDEVADKYCSKYPQISQCVENLTDTLTPCLNSTEQQYLNQTLAFLQHLKQYSCSKNGNHIAMFISNGGVECLETVKDDFEQCFNVTNEDRINVFLGVISLKHEVCEDLMVVRRCVYGKLTKCKGDIPANVIDAFFRDLKKRLSCTVRYRFVIEEKEDDLWIRVMIVGVYFVAVVIICYKLFQ